MRPPAPPVNRRARQRLLAATALLSLTLWLFMAVAESWTPLHAWLHGGSIPDNDDCAVVAITHGKVQATDCAISVPTPVAWIEVTPQVVVPDFFQAIALLPCGRAPPVLPVAS